MVTTVEKVPAACTTIWFKVFLVSCLLGWLLIATVNSLFGFVTLKARSTGSMDYILPYQLAAAPPTKRPQKSPVKVLVLAYPRTGSSLTGEVLAAGNDTAYFYEPYHHLNFTGKDRNHSLETTKLPRKLVEGFLMDVFACNKAGINSLKGRMFFHRHKNWDRCNETDTVIAKVIRLHWINFEPWLYESDIKVIHLVRDPRAMWFSMLKAKPTWKRLLNDAKALCDVMLKDTKLLETNLPPNRLFHLQYEDVVHTPKEILTKLYKQLELPVDHDAIESLKDHLTSPEKISVYNGVKSNSYMTTYRGPDHEANAWRKKMKLNQTRLVEESCGPLMDYFGYAKIT